MATRILLSVLLALVVPLSVWAQGININQLPPATTPLGSQDLLMVQQACAGNANGCTRKVTAPNVGGSTNPGGANTNVQINNAGAFFGSADFSWLTASDTLLIGTSALPPTIQPNTSASTGVALTLLGGTPAATSAGGAVNIKGAVGGSTSGTGGALILASGAGASTATVTSGTGGAINITAGRGALGTSAIVPAGNGGAINITAGTGVGCLVCPGNPVGDGGAISIVSGAPDSVNGGQGNGGNIAITAGSSFGVSTPKTGGSVAITAGGAGSPGSDTPGNVSIFSGTTVACGSTEIGVGNVFSSLKFAGSAAGACVTTFNLGTTTAPFGNRLIGKNSGGVALGTAVDCGQGCFAAQLLATTGYTVAGLPTCNAGVKGAIAYVTDAAAPTYNAALTGGGAVIVPVFCNGTSWTSH